MKATVNIPASLLGFNKEEPNEFIVLLELTAIKKLDRIEIN
jgi:hypothetical protein